MEEDFPYKNRKRALRRHLRMKAKRKARNIAKFLGLYEEKPFRLNPLSYYNEPRIQEKREFQRKFEETLDMEQKV